MTVPVQGVVWIQRDLYREVRRHRQWPSNHVSSNFCGVIGALRNVAATARRQRLTASGFSCRGAPMLQAAAALSGGRFLWGLVLHQAR